MKKLIYIGIVLSACLLIFSSCGDFLDQESKSDITEIGLGVGADDDSIKYTKADQIEQLLTSAYSSFANEFWQLDWYIINDAQSDNAYSGEQKEQSLQFDEYRLNATNASVQRDWKYMYEQIARANSVIQWAPVVPDPALTATRKKEVAGEASFIRALCYFNLVRLYGSVPLVLKEVPSISNENLEEVYPLLYPEKATKEAIYEQIVKDLTVAITDAPAFSANKFKGTKAVCNLIMAQVYATKDGFNGTDWTKVKEYANAVVSNSNYDLMPAYDDLFAVDAQVSNGILPSMDLKNENSKESLFEVDYTSWSTLGNWGSQMFYGIDWKKFNTPSQDLYQAFTAAGDIVRRDASIMFGDVTGKWADKYWPSNHYPYCYKLRSQEKGNIVLFRLAEAILLLAEAENELGNLSVAQGLLNKVRKRAKLGNTTATTKDDLRLAIEHENRFEFAFEGKRWMDLVRRGRFIQVMRNCSDHQKSYAINNLNENKLIWPIPQSEREKNRKLTQNPGY